MLIAKRIESCVLKYKKQRVQRLHKPIYLNMNIYIILNILLFNVLFHAMCESGTYIGNRFRI